MIRAVASLIAVFALLVLPATAQKMGARETPRHACPIVQHPKKTELVTDVASPAFSPVVVDDDGIVWFAMIVDGKHPMGCDRLTGWNRLGTVAEVQEKFPELVQRIK